jgi:hypothetical protein
MTDFDEIVNEAIRLSKRPNVLQHTFKQQLDFIRDPARLKVLFCTRRAAKSYTAGVYMIHEAMNNPGCNCLFIGLTRASAKGIIWKDILKTMNISQGLGISFNESSLVATFPNGSVIYVTGVDVDEDEMNKLLGKKYRLVCIDEASMYTIDMHKLVYGILKPAITDQRGSICLMGTSSNFTRGLFYDITTGKEPGWALHRWSAFDNPFIARQWAEELEEIDRLRPLFKDTPLYKQWYLNEWVVDTDKLVYKYDFARNSYKETPKSLSPMGWTYILGVDLGYEDDTAFVLCAFHDNDKTLFVLKTFNKKHMDITDVANKIKEFRDDKDYPVSKVIIDGANKQAVEEIQHRHHIALEPADKTGKSDFIEIMNAELIQGKIKIKQSLTAITQELMGLVWVTEGDKIKFPRKEHPNLPNHLCDALLYAWRFCYQWLAEPEAEKIVKGSKRWYELQADNQWEREREFLERQQGGENLWPSDDGSGFSQI